MRLKIRYLLLLCVCATSCRDEAHSDTDVLEVHLMPKWVLEEESDLGAGIDVSNFEIGETEDHVAEIKVTWNKELAAGWLFNEEFDVGGISAENFRELLESKNSDHLKTKWQFFGVCRFGLINGDGCYSIAVFQPETHYFRYMFVDYSNNRWVDLSKHYKNKIRPNEVSLGLHQFFTNYFNPQHIGD